MLLHQRVVEVDGPVSGCRLEIRLKPRAKNERLSIGPSGLLDIAVTSPPVDGKANEHLIALLADRLDLPKRALTLIRGGHSKNKVVEVAGLTKEEVIKRVKPHP
jgi:uncharacterized protein (TIGR00251 family)